MAVIRTYRPDYGGLEVWDDRDPDSPVYLNPGILAANWDGVKLTPAGVRFLDEVIAARAAAAVEAAKRAAIDAALQEEFERRKADVDYDKPPEDAVEAVFPRADAIEVSR